MRFLKVDIKRVFTEPAFYYCLFAGIVLAGISLVTVLAGNPGSYGAGELFRHAQPMLLPFVAPLLAAAPYSNMNMLEKDTGYALYIKGRLGKGGYEFRRFLTAGIGGGVCTAVPVLILWLSCAAAGAFFGAGSAAAAEVGPNAGLTVSAMDFWFGFSCAVLAYGLTFVGRKRYLPVVCPEVFYLLFTYAFPYLGLNEYYPPLFYTPWASEGGTGANVPAMSAILIGSGLLLAAFGKVRRLCGRD